MIGNGVFFKECISIIPNKIGDEGHTNLLKVGNSIFTSKRGGKH
jgi:hypothetical protein